MFPTQTEKETELFDDERSSALSLGSTITGDSLDDKHFASFRPSRTLCIAAQGIAAFRLPLPSRELEIPIYDSADGTLAYVSTRQSTCSGNAILSDPKRGDLVRTDYFFGPGRDPVISMIEGSKSKSLPVRVSSRWTSRATSFKTPDGWELEWNYTKRKDSNGQKENLIVLRLKDAKSKKEQGKVLAQLLRGGETRTAGSSPSSAGNGGQLLIDEEAAKFVEEPLLVATCLLMLKKEIDRRRAMQFMMVGAIASGGL
ncbi:hypothetical protein Asppvi_005776 [Aspergillus pseudoviridinutans]|uniref:Uncharacterized protein n=1 Tax=Aspergillus pseudoviridinutans TaxID=1517512 RepID=A0A9P3BCY0_9EURO|nr:uncharacterized protein Asppvi_005776 [Aspergillus pseudoviridinutans]GIJ86878.1 hypothetical protein Asppvi_005776 [Aspergillus pseudoviridinutans]